MLRVFTAKSVITMNPSLPRATAVAVEDGLIVEAGDLSTMKPWLDAREHIIDDQFADCVIPPGFIDPHLHPSMAAVLLPMHFVTAMEWKLPWGTVALVRTAAKFVERVSELVADPDEAQEPLFVWGYHQFWHGEMSRAMLNELSPTRPAVVWHRSFHELFMNDAALAWLDISEAEARGRRQVNYADGHFFENGLGYALSKLNPYILSRERYAAGLERLKRVVHQGGHTTIGDMAVGLFDFDMEWDAAASVLDTDDTPFRVEMIPHALRVRARHSSDEEAVAFIRSLPERNTRRLRFSNGVKLFADGAFFSQLAQIGAPGYIDGPEGEWLMTPERLEAAMRTYWNAGMRIHLHATGDLGVQAGLDALEQLQSERPRRTHGFTFEHFGFSTPEQVRRIASLGASVSANAYYVYELSDMFARKGVGYERASRMARLGTCFAEGVCTALHSDFTMAPAEPLNSAWVAVNRVNCEGDVMGAEERLTLEQALAAITINAARVLGREDEIGSIRAGKKADFTVLASDPLEGDPAALRDIPIIATVFERDVHSL